MEIPEVTVNYSIKCPISDVLVERSVDPSSLSFYPLRSIYDDCDDGFEMVDRFTCPKCNTPHEITIFQDKPFGCV